MKTLAIFAAAAALAVSARGETVTAEPDAFLEYIEATGSQYINTGVNAETGLKAYVDFAWATYSGNPDWSLLDACTVASASDNRSRIFLCHMYNGKPFFAYGLEQRRNPAGAVPFVGGQRCTIVTDMSNTNSLELIQDGVKTFDDDDRETFATNGNVNLNLNLFVFATNYGGSANWKGQGKLYEMKIFKKNATTGEFDLLRHYIPCIKDNRAGLYDTVNGTISFSLGSADFIAGSVTNTVIASYVDADGTLHEKVIAIPLDNTMTELNAGWYVVNSNVTVNSRINLTGNTNLILADGYTLDVKGIYIPQGSTLTIYAQSDGETAGKIVSHPSDGAAIGGKPGNDNGNIVICGGIIEATGGDYCAGIGSADGQAGGTITIYGGTVTAKGGADAAAIGGGRNCSGGTIDIYGGIITTDSDPCENGAGIGGGDGGSGGTITIYGGNIMTYSRDGAGIGGGDEGDGGIITINGGTITSVKVNQGHGARIGGGCDAAPGTIIINGGTITTVGGSGAGIGGGKRNPAGGTVTINGGIINASGSYGIGAGEGGADVAITLGWTKATDQIYASSYNGTVTIVGGQAFINDASTPEVVSGTDIDKALVNGKTLRPCVLLTEGAANDYSDRTSGLTTWVGQDMTVAFQRTFNVGKASTICLPFPMTSIEGGTVYGFVGVTYNNTDGWVATMQDASPTNKVDATTANKPYLFLPDGTSGTVDVTFTGSMDAVASVAAGNDPQGDWTFYGTYSRLGYGTAPFDDPVFGFAANDGSNGVVAGEFVRATTNAYIPAFRAFLKYSGSDTYLQARATRSGEAGIPEYITVRLIGKDGEIDGIGEIRLSTGEVTFDSNVWYDLNGRKLDGKPTQKGIYINGNKKVVIK